MFLIAEIIFTLVFLIFLKSWWFFLNYSSLTYDISSFLLVLQNHKITAFGSLWLSPLKHQKVKNSNNKLDKKIIRKAS